ncbi:ASCH domain-containing protein [Bacillus toyonensis]|uniref:ASCH domain-containing protein n=1 Tax=Bacillus toyonensis TaxID=155322 RepID=UPI0025404130|nr:ASCH domain-containing protein [Bacillus toyonensis]WIG34153.1 ASCH domain-containing protein [Bacillus toyonensis]
MRAQENELNISVIDAWMFGDGSKEMRDELRSLDVKKGIKTEIYAAHCVYGLEGEEIQKFGQYDIVLAGDNTRLAIIKYTEIDFLKMNEVTSDFSRSEGTGDLSYDYWYSERVEFLTWELSPYGLTFAPDLLLICQTFRVMDIYKDRV